MMSEMESKVGKKRGTCEKEDVRESENNGDTEHTEYKNRQSSMNMGNSLTSDDHREESELVYDEESGRYIETRAGIKYGCEEDLRCWMPTAEEYIIQQQHKAYEFPQNGGHNSYSGPDKKTKLSKGQKEHEKTSQQQNKKKNKPNCSIYVSGLPPDVTVEELEESFLKYGVIAKDSITEKPRIKIYKDSNGINKGDAIITYFREESVKLSIDLCDGCELRPGQPSTKLSVQEAVFREKKDYNEEERTKKLAEKLGIFDADPKLVNKVLAKRREKFKKIFDWSDEIPETKLKKKLDRTVVMKHMFTLDEIKDSPTLILDIKDDIKSEFDKYGTIEKITVYDRLWGTDTNYQYMNTPEDLDNVETKPIILDPCSRSPALSHLSGLEPEGIVAVQMNSPINAKSCVQHINKRYFAGREIDAFIPTSRVRYKQSSARSYEKGEGHDTHESFGKWLESDY